MTGAVVPLGHPCYRCERSQAAGLPLLSSVRFGLVDSRVTWL